MTVDDLVAAVKSGRISLETFGDLVVSNTRPQPVQKRMAPAKPQRYVLGVAYPARKADGHGEWISDAELEKTAWDYVRKHRRMGWYHAGIEGHGEIVESYIWRGPDWVTSDIDGNEQVIKAGDWLLGAVLDGVGLEMVLSGKADGWSIDGAAKRRIAAPPAA